MKFNYESINKNLKVYYEAREILPVIKEYEERQVNSNVMRSLGLQEFADFYEFLSSIGRNGFDPVMSDMNWRKLKPIMIDKTSNKRFKTFLSNRTQNQFINLLNSDGESFDRYLNGRWISKPRHTNRGRRTYGRRSEERLESFETCFVPIMNYIIQNEIDVYEKSSMCYDSFVNQSRYSNFIKWYTRDILSYDKIPKREIDVTRNLLTNLAQFIDESKIDFRKLNFDYVNSVITDKIRKLMNVPNGTMLKCIKDYKYSNGTSYLTEGLSYEVRSCSMNNGYVRVLVTNDMGRSEWCEYSYFEDMSIHRDDILSSLFG